MKPWQISSRRRLGALALGLAFALGAGADGTTATWPKTPGHSDRGSKVLWQQVVPINFGQRILPSSNFTIQPSRLPSAVNFFTTPSTSRTCMQRNLGLSLPFQERQMVLLSAMP